MQSSITKLNEICTGFNKELWEKQNFAQTKIDKLEKWRTIFTKIKRVLLPLLVFEGAVIASFLFTFTHETIANMLDDILGMIFILWIITLLVLIASKKVIEKIFQEENDIQTSILLREAHMKEEYVEKIYYPYVATKFQGEYDKQQLESELNESGLSLYDSVEYLGGLSGMCEGIPFKENYISILCKKLDGTTETAFEGTVLQLPNPKPCMEPVYVQHVLHYFFTEKTVPDIKVDNTRFNASVVVRSNDKVSAFRVLTPKYMEQILSMIDAVKIPALVYGKEHVLVFVRNERINRTFEPQFPFDVPQCDSSADKLYKEKREFIKQIYTDIVESMR